MLISPSLLILKKWFAKPLGDLKGPGIWWGMKTQYLPELDHYTLTKNAAQRRSDAWELLRKTGASLTWHPVAIDKVLNASEANPITSLAAAVEAAESGTPILFDSANRLVEVLSGKRENSPFYMGFLRPVTISWMPASLKGNSGLIDRAADVLWDAMAEIENAYIPVGVAANGLPRPHYFHNFLQICLRTAGPKVARFCQDVSAKSLDDSSDNSQYADPAVLSPESEMENKECRTHLKQALATLPRSRRMHTVFDLLVIQGFSIREAERVSGLGKSTIQREAQTLARHLQTAFAKYYGLPVKGEPDAATIISAIRTMVLDGVQFPGYLATRTPAKTIPFPAPSENQPDQCA